MPRHPSFQAHIDLLHVFLTRRTQIVEAIQDLLNAQRRPLEYLRDAPVLSRHFEECFFTRAVMPHDQLRLRGQLDEAHRNSGFTPRDIPGLHNGPIDPAEMMVRAFHLWQQTRWPGRKGRVRYANTLFNLYVIRCLELLSLRLWDESGGAGDRLRQIQLVLDQLWATSPIDQPVLLRDARWLIPLAQSPATDELGIYFDVAEKIAGTLSNEDRLEIHSAGVRMVAGHLRSQIRYHSSKKAMAVDENRVVLITRNSNALDFALQIQELVPLLEAYEQACRLGDAEKRLGFADAICQGVSPDPELFLNRLDLLGGYSTIEHLFTTTDPEGHVVLTPVGRRHVQLLEEYAARIDRVSKPLNDDVARFRPVTGAYSPYGVLYGFSSDLLEHMALKATQPDVMTQFGLEDVFIGGEPARQKLDWVSGWRKLPHLTPEVQRLFDYPQLFAETMFARIERALRRRADGDAGGVARTGRLFIGREDAPPSDAERPPIPDLPLRYIASSDRQLVAAGRAEFRDAALLASDRREGRCLVSYETPGGRVALAKDLLTEVLGAGRDARIAGLPSDAAAALTLLCPSLVNRSASPESSR